MRTPRTSGRRRRTLRALPALLALAVAVVAIAAGGSLVGERWADVDVDDKTSLIDELTRCQVL